MSYREQGPQLAILGASPTPAGPSELIIVLCAVKLKGRVKVSVQCGGRVIPKPAAALVLRRPLKPENCLVVKNRLVGGNIPTPDLSKGLDLAKSRSG